MDLYEGNPFRAELDDGTTEEDVLGEGFEGVADEYDWIREFVGKEEADNYADKIYERRFEQIMEEYSQ